MKSLPIIAGIIVLLLIAGGTYFLVKGSPVSTPQPSPETAIEQASSSGTESMGSSMPSSDSGSMAATKEVTISSSNFKYTPSLINVNKGDKVKITLKDNGGMHDLFIDSYDVKTKVIESGQEDSIEFIADKAGTFDFWCTIGNHKAMGMVGKLVVQ